MVVLVQYGVWDLIFLFSSHRKQRNAFPTLSQPGQPPPRFWCLSCCQRSHPAAQHAQPPPSPDIRFQRPSGVQRNKAGRGFRVRRKRSNELPPALRPLGRLVVDKVNSDRSGLSRASGAIIVVSRRLHCTQPDWRERHGVTAPSWNPLFPGRGSLPLAFP